MDLDDLYRILRSSHVQAQGIVNTVRDPLLVLDADLTVVSANAAFYKTFETGRDETVGVPFTELGNGQWDIEELRLLLDKVIPKSDALFDYEVTAKFPAVGHRTMLVSAQRITQAGSGRRVLLLTIVDATERKQKEVSQDILIGELYHRIKNVLSITQALARQTSVDDRTAAEYRDAFLGRFQALEKVLLMTARGDATELSELMHKVLEPYREPHGAVELAEGPMVSLSTSQAMALGMILQELATNALKYGALSVPGGKVTMTWNLDGNGKEPPQVRLSWQERHGPKTAPPKTNGFGTRLIEFAAQIDLGGELERSYDPDGLTVSLTFRPE